MRANVTDIVSKETRSRMMSGIRGKDTRPEMLVRRRLHSLGFRFRLHAKTLPGRPDLVLPKYRTVIFVHGCFWHRHADCKYATSPRSNQKFWQDKFESNIKRDKSAVNELLGFGWRIIVIWECSMRNKADSDHYIDWLATALKSDSWNGILIWSER